ncbi:MAG: serine/threonine protein kinase [Planctomycetaceae bacterium]|jgi:serine/threonine-protein kinase|nr:serine/threonine protein kinase [Planctomycetaceae bacterium]
MESAEPEKLGPFLLHKIIGRGGMGIVYEAVHEETGAAAAVKVLLTLLDDDAEVRLRFESEIETLKRLRHANIVRLLGFGNEQGKLYYAMEYVNGFSLQQELRKKRVFQWFEAAKIGLDICQGLRHAHDRGVIHRDLKPANILLDHEGNVKLSDFGIARFFGSQQITDIHSIVGTLEFMSPEQANANPVNSRTDLYSLGCVLYMLLMQRPPFIARSLPELLRKHQSPAPPIRSARYDVPDELEWIITALLQHHPEDRPKNASIVAKRLLSLLQALMGPPDTIKVLPMPEAPIQIHPVTLPAENSIRTASGIIAENGIIDLGGIVLPEETDTTNRHSPETSFSAPSDDEETPLYLSVDKPSGTEQATVAFSAEEQEVIFQHRLLPAEHSSNPPRTSILTVPVRHGEVIKNRTKTMRQAEDEPLPDDDVFQPLPPDTPETAETPQNPLPAAVIYPPLNPLPLNAVPPDNIPDKNTGTDFRNRSGGLVADGTASPASRKFISVSEKDLDFLAGEEVPFSPAISIPTIITSLALIAAGLTIYYLLLPPSPETLYGQISTKAESGKADNGYTLDSLRSVQNSIRQFLSLYPNHPQATNVQHYANELELAEQERRIERRIQFAPFRSLNPVERTYSEIVNALPNDPEQTAAKLRAFIQVFQSPPVNDGQDILALTPAELCVELARRRLKILEKETAAAHEEQSLIVRKRLTEAAELDAANPLRAKEIRQGIIELYSDQCWAKEIIEEARQQQIESEKTKTNEQ